VALVLAGGLAAAGSTSATPGASAKASLEIRSLEPLRVVGDGFRPYERVRVTVWTGGTRTTRRARAGRRGAFALRLPGSPSGSCGSLRLRAVGSLGSRVTVALDNVTCLPAS
jgi:hypothetical protein